MERYRSGINLQRPVNMRERSSSAERDLKNRGRKISERFNELRDIDTASNEVRLREVKAHNKNVTAIAYRGEPFIYDFFYANRELHDLIPTIKTLYEEGAISGINPSVLEEKDLFIQKFRGLSLMDIENMDVDPKTHELAPEDIRRINRMFRTSGIFRIGREKDQAYVLEQLIYFASRQWIHPEIGVPRSLKKLHENITAYFDYYTSFLTDFNRDSLSESIMLIMFALGTPYLLMAVASYVPAKLNITPSSSIKLYRHREELADNLGLKGTWRQLEKLFFPVFKQAYRNDALPKDLEQYQHYNEEVDYAAANILQSYMQKTVSVEEQLKKRDEVKTVLEQWNRHKRDVIRELMQDPKKRIEYQISKNHPGEKITMIKNRDTLVFIMHFTDNVHLTLELDKTGKLFGIPPSLVKAYPHVSDVFITDILKPLLGKYKAKDAPDNNQQDTAAQISTTSLELPIASDSETSTKVIQEEDEVIKPLKRKKLVQALTIFEPDPLPPTTPPVSRAERFVAYSEDKIRELIGPQVSRQQSVVDQILRAINSFQHGHTNGVLLKGSHERIVHIRAGYYRIFLNRLEKGVYTLRTISHRREAY